MPHTARVHRRDFGGVTSKVTRTPQGGVRLDAALTRTGVFTYRDHEGRSWREYRPAEEVFRDDSLATLEAAPVTELHPEKMVDAETWSSVTVGTLAGSPRRDGIFVVAPLTVQRADAAAKVERRELHDVSAGYTCRVDWTAGVSPEGERYDAIQRDIQYNHFALGPEGWGRAGTDVSLRIDGAAEQVRGESAPKGITVRKIKIKGREYKLDADDEVAAAQQAVEEQTAAVDSMGAKLQAAEEALKGAIGEIAALKAKIEAEEKSEPKVTEDMVSEEVADAIASKRIALRERAARVLGEEKLDGLSAHEIHRKVIAKTLPTVKLDGIDAKALEGMFIAATEGATETKRADSLRNAHPGPATPRAEHDDSEDNLSPAAALNRRTHNHFDSRGRAATTEA
jgi:hypothetical protein